MSLNHIKAPEHLKSKTISLMKKESNNKTKRKPFKSALIVACIPILFTLTAFAYSLFSGIDGDELSVDAHYQGNGIATIMVENLAEKDLQFVETVKLERWSTAEEIFEIEQVMPVIKPTEKAVIKIEIPKEYIESLETPILDTDWYHFVLTTNDFAFGQSWMASLTFAEPIITKKPEITPPAEIPVEDNTVQDDVDAIKNNFVLQNPLCKLEVTFDYNDYVQDDEYTHPELDLAAKLGTEIYPLSSGTVIETDFDAEIGRYIIIDHGNGLVSQYAHCNELLKETGDTVDMNDVIATVGKTGMATGSHLGFSVTFNEMPINPKTLFTE